MAKKSIVVVGAGYAGVSATKYMAKKLKKDNDVEITLIDCTRLPGDVSSRPQSNMTCNVCFHVRKMFA